MIYIIIFILILIGLIAHHLTSKTTYLIVYRVTIEGKQEYHNIKYEISPLHGVPTNQECKIYLEHILNGCEGLTIIDVHELA